MKAVVVGLVLLGCVGMAWADEANGARFTMPAGWSGSDKDGARVAVPGSLQDGELMVAIVLGAQPCSGTPSQKIDEVAAAVNSDAKVLSATAITTQRGAGGSLYTKSFNVNATDGGAHARTIAVLVRDKQCAIAVFAMNSAGLDKHAAGMTTILGSLAVSGSETTAPAAETPSAIPTGDTPDAYPGSSAFRPSGKGVAVPAARIVDGRPEGIWWYPQVRGGKTVAMRVIYLADGTCATSPRPGGPRLFDLEGQRRLGGVGTCKVANGVLARSIDGHDESSKLTSGTDKEGAYMNLGAMRHRPLASIDPKRLVGTWKSTGNTYTFRADGTYTSGYVSDAGGVGNGGTWAADGYVLFVRPSGGNGWVSTIGATTNNFIIIDSTPYTRQ